MKIFRTVRELENYLAPFHETNRVLGFVPTMGALHDGHLALIRRCKGECDLTACSIFINPLQFDNPDDFRRYPNTLEHDISLLESSGCDVLFAPDVAEMYPEKVQAEYSFGLLDRVMEGKFRPGHFSGVAIVVKRLFDIIKPQRSYFGEKDYQQLMIIKRLIEIHDMNIQIVPCPIVREEDGLAMSSRNRLLSVQERELAPVIYRIIRESVAMADILQPAGLLAWVTGQFRSYPPIELQYYELSDANSLEPVTEWQKGQEVIACVAAFLGKVRLIDNIRFFRNFAG